MNNMKIGVKLALGFGFAVLMFLLMWGVGFYALSSYDTEADRMVAEDVSMLEHAMRARSNILGMRRYEKDIFINIDSTEAVEKYYKKWETECNHFKERIAHLEKIADADEKPMLRDITKNASDYMNGFTGVFKRIQAGEFQTPQAANEAITPFKDQTHRMIEQVRDLSDKAVSDMKKAGEGLDKLNKNANQLMFLISISAMTALVGLAFYITRGLLSQLGGEPAYAAEITKRISEGNLALTMQVKPGDNTSLLASMQNMQAHLRDMIGQVLINADQLSNVAGSLASSASQVAVSSNQQSEAAASTAATVEEMTTSFDRVTANANEAHAIARHAGELSTQGGAVVHDAVLEMNKIADAVNQSAQFIQTLGEHSSQISAIVNTIKDIADQTNLLALNAAIEAARAGEQGRGFAVVADEVRKLAERTTQSTQEISGMINTIQNGTQNAIASMQEGSSRVTEGVAMANRAGESMDRIREGANQVVSEVNDITAALREQGAASHQVARNVEKIAQMTEENSAAVTEIAGASQNMKHLAEQLQGSVSRFKV